MQPTERCDFGDAAGGVPIVDGHAILELKYRDEMPRVFGELIETFSLIPQPVSKYRLAMAESELHVEV